VLEEGGYVHRHIFSHTALWADIGIAVAFSALTGILRLREAEFLAHGSHPPGNLDHGFFAVIYAALSELRVEVGKMFAT
jgi:hypothetical protein